VWTPEKSTLAVTPLEKPSLVPIPSIYFGPRHPTPFGKEEPSGTGAGRRLLKTTGLVMRWYKTHLTKILDGFGMWTFVLFHDCQSQCVELTTPRFLVLGRPGFPEKPLTKWSQCFRKKAMISLYNTSSNSLVDKIYIQTSVRVKFLMPLVQNGSSVFSYPLRYPSKHSEW
jgi:hypothetical protein